MNFLKQSWFIIVLICISANLALQANSSKQAKELKSISKEIEQLKAILQRNFQTPTQVQTEPQPINTTTEKQLNTTPTSTTETVKLPEILKIQTNTPIPPLEKATPVSIQPAQIIPLPITQDIKKSNEKNTQSPQQKIPATKTSNQTQNKEEIKIEEEKNNRDLLDFEVKNETGKTVYICCFYYMKKQDFNRWKWDKTDVQKIENNQTVTVKPDIIKNKRDRENTYGYLAIFNNEQEAEDSSYELAHDKNKIDIDLLCKLKNKTIRLQAEKYGFKEEKLDYEFINNQSTSIDAKATPKLDFYVENKSGQPLYVTSFIYEKKPNMPIWQYSKGPIVLIQPDDIICVPVIEVKAEYERIYTRGYLGIFRANEKDQADDSTFELLKPSQKMSLGLLTALKDQKILLGIEKYGVNGDFIDFVTKPIQSPLKNRRV